MKKHFKLFELESHQVMLERASDDEDGEHVIIATYLNDSDIRASYKLGFGVDSQQADKCIEEFTQQQAEEVVIGMKSMLND